jgi:short-subunit dehydrogenase
MSASAADQPPSAGHALVTGASSGIGLEIARELAGRGYSLLLVSERGPALGAAVRELAAAHEVQVDPLVMDLARPGAARALYQEVRSRGLQIDVLVSNAGFLMYGDVADIDPERAESMMNLHVVTPSLLAHYFGQDMRARREGHMLFTSSIAAWRSSPGIAYYCSSKRFLMNFARALRAEMSESGVSVTCLAPGAVATPLYDGMGIPLDKAIKAGVMKHPEQIARKAVAAMFRRKAVVVPCLSAKVMAFGTSLTPSWVLKRTRGRHLVPNQTKE